MIRDFGLGLKLTGTETLEETDSGLNIWHYQSVDLGVKVIALLSISISVTC